MVSPQGGPDDQVPTHSNAAFIRDFQKRFHEAQAAPIVANLNFQKNGEFKDAQHAVDEDVKSFDDACLEATNAKACGMVVDKGGSSVCTWSELPQMGLCDSYDKCAKETDADDCAEHSMCSWVNDYCIYTHGPPIGRDPDAIDCSSIDTKFECKKHQSHPKNEATDCMWQVEEVFSCLPHYGEDGRIIQHTPDDHDILRMASNKAIPHPDDDHPEPNAVGLEFLSHRDADVAHVVHHDNLGPHSVESESMQDLNEETADVLGDARVPGQLSEPGEVNQADGARELHREVPDVNADGYLSKLDAEGGHETSENDRERNHEGEEDVLAGYGEEEEERKEEGGEEEEEVDAGGHPV